jgi:kinesin family protein C1
MSSLDDLLSGGMSPYKSSGRTPLKDVRPSFYNTISSTTANLNGRFSTVTSCSSTTSDLVQARIDHLEKERVELSLQIQTRDETLRTRKLKIEAMEISLKLAEESKSSMSKELEQIRDNFQTNKQEKYKLELEVQQLKNQCKLQTEKESETQKGLWNKMTAASRELRRVEDESKELRKERNEFAHTNSILKNDIDDKTIKMEEDSLQISDLSNSIIEADNIRRELTEKSLEYDTIKIKLDEYESINEEINITLDEERESFKQEKIKGMKVINDLKNQILTFKKEKETQMLEFAEGSNIDVQSINKDSNNFMLVKMLEDIKKKYTESEIKRKKLHNSLQEIRGNIRVFVRCRPFLSGDGEEAIKAAASIDKDEQGCVRFHKDGSSVSLKNTTRGTGQIYNFDHVFSMNSSQEKVFDEVSELVQSALDGYKVCIFSYGQTGSGKTHTMTGNGEGDLRGIIPRSVEQIISRVLVMSEEGWNINVTASIVEIYNEELRDLLTTSNSKDSSSKLKISNLQGRTTIAGLTSVDIDTSSLSSGMLQLSSLIDQSTKSRTTACTGMNETSSRSHSLFIIDITGTHNDGVTHMRGGLRLVDLAGSERLDRTGTLNDVTRLKETVNINKSLSCLADVFVALSNKAPHIPYRNSKLTMILQECLSGDGKALMFVNVSPTQASSHETVCSLRFANQVSQVELGKAQKQMLTQPIVNKIITAAPVKSVDENIRIINNKNIINNNMNNFPPPSPIIKPNTINSNNTNNTNLDSSIDLSSSLNNNIPLRSGIKRSSSILLSSSSSMSTRSSICPSSSIQRKSDINTINSSSSNNQIDGLISKRIKSASSGVSRGGWK